MRKNFIRWYQLFMLGTLVLLTALAAAAQPTVNLVTDFGAVGNGVANDHGAFTAAEAYLNAHPNGAKLIIPAGTYLVGRQGTPGDPGIEYYHADDVLSLTQCSNITIEGTGTVVLKFQNGLKFGHFNGEYWTPGYCFRLNSCNSVTIRNITVEGNSDNYDFGGDANNYGMEGDNDGVFVYNTRGVTLANLTVRHMGRDGVQLKFSDGTYPAAAAPVNLAMTDCVFDENGRDGFSWVSGSGVYATNCSFSRQARGLIRAGLKTGIDVEPEGGNYLSNGKFQNCQFVNNLNTGVLVDYVYGSIDQAQNIEFNSCTISGNYQPGVGEGGAIVALRPSLRFIGCTVYGELRNAYNATDDVSSAKFSYCTFTDSPLNGLETTKNTLVQFYHSGARTQFTDCNFTIHSYDHGFLQIDNLGDPVSQNIQFRNSRFHTDYAQPFGLGTPIAGTKATNATFDGDCRFVDGTNFGPRAPRNPSGSCARIETPILRFWPAQITGTLTLAGGPDLRYIIDYYDITVKAGGSLNINDRNELISYGGDLHIEEGATLTVNSGGQLSTVGGGTVHVDGTLIVRAGGFICADYGQPIIVGPRGRIQYDPGANLGYDPLRYPPACGGKNCQGTPYSNLSVKISDVSVRPKLDDTWGVTATSLPQGGSGNYTYQWYVDILDGQGFKPLPYATDRVLDNSVVAPRSQFTLAVVVTDGAFQARAEFYVSGSGGPYATERAMRPDKLDAPAQPQAEPVYAGVYPSPANAYIEVQAPVENSAQASAAAVLVPESFQVEVYTTTGKLYYSGTLSATPKRIDTAHWPAGLYLVRLTGNHQVVNQRIAIKH